MFFNRVPIFLGLMRQEAVALKTTKSFNRQDITDFYKEISIVLELDHENIVKSHGYYLLPPHNKPHLILEFMEHGDLKDILQRGEINGHLLRQVILQTKES